MAATTKDLSLRGAKDKDIKNKNLVLMANIFTTFAEAVQF